MFCHHFGNNLLVLLECEQQTHAVYIHLYSAFCVGFLLHEHTTKFSLYDTSVPWPVIRAFYSFFPKLFISKNQHQWIEMAATSRWGLQYWYIIRPLSCICIEVTICKITRLTAHFMCGLMSDLLICTCL